MVRVEVIRKRLNKLDEYLGILRGLQRYSFDEFVSRPEVYGSVERFLQLSIEAVTDIGNHVIADLSLGMINWYRDVPTILAKKGYISLELREKWIRMIGFRNTLVHDYVEIDRRVVYAVLQEGLDDLEALGRALAEFL